MQAVFLDYDTVSKGDLDASALLRDLPRLQFRGVTEAADVAASIANAEIVLVNHVQLAREHFEGAGRLKLIAVAGTGTDNLDLGAARASGIGVCNVPGYCSQSVTQQVWALILGLNQHMAEYTRLATDGSWVERPVHTALAFPIRELSGRTFGIVGWGELGKAAAAVAQGFGMNVAIANRPGGDREAGRLDLDEVLAISDVLSLHCPLTVSTRGMIGARELALMKPSALLINTARGGLVDSRALAAALKSGRLGGAGIDVLAQEPPVDGDPLLDPTIPNLLLTPHVAWAAIEARQRCLDEMAANIHDYLAGGRRARLV